MKLNPIGANQAELVLNNGTKVLFSFQTPVATVSCAGGLAFYTEKKFSKTTSRHINQWLEKQSFTGVGGKPQEFFDDLVK